MTAARLEDWVGRGRKLKVEGIEEVEEVVEGNERLPNDAATAAVAAPPSVARAHHLSHPRPTPTMRVHPPPLLPPSHLPSLYNTERAKLGSLPNMRPNLVTPTRCVRPPPSPHSTRTPPGSQPHDCRLINCEQRTKRQVSSGDLVGNCSSDVLATF